MHPRDLLSVLEKIDISPCIWKNYIGSPFSKGLSSRFSHSYTNVSMEWLLFTCLISSFDGKPDVSLVQRSSSKSLWSLKIHNQYSSVSVNRLSNTLLLGSGTLFRLSYAQLYISLNSNLPKKHTISNLHNPSECKTSCMAWCFRSFQVKRHQKIHIIIIIIRSL